MLDTWIWKQKMFNILRSKVGFSPFKKKKRKEKKKISQSKGNQTTKFGQLIEYNKSNWSNFIGRLPLLLEILSNMFIAIIYFLGCDVINLTLKLTLSF